MIPVGWLHPSKDCWDSNLLRRLFDNALYPTGLKFKHIDGFPNTDNGCALVLPGRYWYEHYDRINTAIARYEWLLLLRTSDEEDFFDVSSIKHRNCRFWVQTPRADRQYGSARLFGVGPTPHFNVLPKTPPKRSIDVFLAAQNTHKRRTEAFEVLGRCEFSKTVIPTEGFTEGITTKRYVEAMVHAKAAPAPSGAVSPDSFRVFEALESHAVPIADDVSPAYDSRGYWNRLFPDAEFPIYTDCDELPMLISDVRYSYPRLNNRVAAWWMQQKRRYAHWLVDDLKALGAI